MVSKEFGSAGCTMLFGQYSPEFRGLYHIGQSEAVN